MQHKLKDSGMMALSLLNLKNPLILDILDMMMTLNGPVHPRTIQEDTDNGDFKPRV